MPSNKTIPMPSDAAGWAVAEMKRLLTSRRMSEWDAVQAACRRASAMKTAAGALASLASSSDGMPASLVKYVAELTTTDMPIDSGVISRCRTWLATNKHEMSKCKTPLAMIASAAPIVDASINNKAKALDPTLTDACHAALKLTNVHYDEKTAEKAAAVAAEKAFERAVALVAAKAAAVAASKAAVVAAVKTAEARARARMKARIRAEAWAEAEAEAEADAEAWAEGWAWEYETTGQRVAVARGRVRESRRRARAAARRGNELKPRSRTSRSCAARTSVRNCARAEECHARDVRRRHSRLAKIATSGSEYSVLVFDRERRSRTESRRRGERWAGRLRLA